MSEYQITIKHVDSQRVAALRETIARTTEIGRMFYDLENAMVKHNARFAGYPVAVWYESDREGSQWDAEAAIPVDLSIEADDKIQMRELPAVEQVACAIHQGAYEGFSYAWAALGKWVEANGYRVAGPCREVYLRYDGTGANVEYPPECYTEDVSQFLTELQFPIEKA